MANVLWQIEKVRTKTQMFVGAALSAATAYLLADNFAPAGPPVVSALFVITLVVVGIIFAAANRRHAISLSERQLIVDGAEYDLGAVESARFRRLIEPMLIVKSGGLETGHGIGWLTKSERVQLETMLQRQ